MNEYKNCMSQKMGSGALKGLTKEERRIEFCAMAKICSKGLSHDEAKEICLSQPPKEKREVKHRRSKKEEPMECPEFDTMKLLPKCEITLGKLAGNGVLPTDLNIPEICKAILI